MSERLTTTRLELRLTAEDEAIIEALRKSAGYPTPTKVDVIRAALRRAVEAPQRRRA